MKNYAEILFINEVKALQEQDGSAEHYAQFYSEHAISELGESERHFIETRESFYIASVSSTGWPYVQHRGGPQGFLKVIGDNKLGFIDYPGNRQFITMGHSESDNRVALFMMDYERRARLKLLGQLSIQHAKDVEPDLVHKLSTLGQARPDRVATIDIVSLDWNCPKYIPELVSKEKVIAFVNDKLGELQKENEALRAQIDQMKS